MPSIHRLKFEEVIAGSPRPLGEGRGEGKTDKTRAAREKAEAELAEFNERIAPLEKEINQLGRQFWVSKEQVVAENYDLSASRYRQIEQEEVILRETRFHAGAAAAVGKGGRERRDGIGENGRAETVTMTPRKGRVRRARTFRLQDRCNRGVAPFDEAFRDATKQATKMPQALFRPFGRVPIIDQGADFIAGYTDDEASAWKGSLPVIVFGDHTRAIKFVGFPFVLGADGCKVLLPSGRLNPRFAYYSLLACNLAAAGYSWHFKFLRELSFRIPENSEQRRIAGQLEQADRLRRTRRYALELSDTFLPAAFLQLFGDPVANTRGWERAKVSELGDVETGNTPPRGNEGYYGKAIEWIKSDNIGLAQIHPSKASGGLSEEGIAVGRVAEAGVLLLTCIAGSETSIGNVVLTDRRVAFNQQINAVTPHQGVNSLFLYGLFLAAKPLIQRSTTLAMKRMITKGKLEELILIKPPLPLQAQFAALAARHERLRVVQREAFARPSTSSSPSCTGPSMGSRKKGNRGRESLMLPVLPRVTTPSPSSPGASTPWATCRRSPPMPTSRIAPPTPPTRSSPPPPPTTPRPA